MEDAKSEGVESTQRQHVTTTTATTRSVSHHVQQRYPKPPRIPKPTTQRKLETNIMDRQRQRYSPYFKIRALVHQLRPRFIQVLRKPDFRSCKEAEEIRKKMNLLMDLHKQMTRDTGTQWKFAADHQHPSLDTEPAREIQDEKQPQQLQPRCSVEKAVQGSTQFIPLSSDKKPEVSQMQGTYIVGGSTFGWNFIVFSGSKPVYYGVTKEAYRSSNNRSGDAQLPITGGLSDTGRAI